MEATNISLSSLTILPDIVKPMPQRTSLQKLLLRSSITILSHDLAFHLKYIMTRVQSLKTSYWIDWNSSVASSIQEPHLIIQRGMANVRDLIKPC